MDTADTRARIIEAGYQRMAAAGVAAVRVADVAAAAGVSRQAVYLHFASRAGLLAEVARHADLRNPHAQAVREALDIRPAVEALNAFVHALCQFSLVALPLLLALDAAARTDAAARAAWNERKDVVRRMLTVIVQRLADEGGLQQHWSIAEAADWCLTRLHPAILEELVLQRGWSLRRVAERIVLELRASLVGGQRPAA
jgi:AcrR family transcriptional regulator